MQDSRPKRPARKRAQTSSKPVSEQSNRGREREGKASLPWVASDLEHVKTPSHLSDLPFPIAHPVEVVLGQQTSESRVEAILTALLGLTRFLALISLAWYLRDTHRNDVIDAGLRRTLSREMSDGHWRKILKDTLAPYQRITEDAFIPELVTFYFHGETGDITHAARRFEEWISFRNDLRHLERVRRLPPPDERATRGWKKLSRALEAISALARYDLVQPQDISLRRRVITRTRLFRGPSRTARILEGLDIPLTAEGVESKESVLLIRRSDPSRQLLLSPFLRVGAEGGLQLLNQIGEKASKLVVQYVTAEAGFLAVTREEESDGEEPLTDLRSLLTGLGVKSGEFGALRSSSGGSMAYHMSILRRWARAWARDGYGYDYILKLEKEEDLKHAIATRSLWSADLPFEVEAYLLLTANHYRLSWRYWAQRNRKNQLAVDQLLGVLNEEEARRFHRPRLRGLYALQLADKNLVKQVLEGRDWPSGSVTLVHTWVLSSRVKVYLRRLAARSGPYPLPQRAAEVLSEIEPSGPGGIDLPIDLDAPERDPEEGQKE